jgi:hypothetical protein
LHGLRRDGPLALSLVVDEIIILCPCDPADTEKCHQDGEDPHTRSVSI